ncbi:MAG TPA: M1 family aminopeptidase [Nitrosospira sp.]|nr:M1 family aminopeptidase [Nitrosospira sp.]
MKAMTKWLRTCMVFSILGVFSATGIASAASADSGASAASQAPTAPEPAEIEYDITVRIDPTQRSIEGNSIITVKKGEELTLLLGRRFGVLSARIDGVALGPAASSGNLRAWSIPSSEQTPRRIEVQWRGELSALDTSIDHPQTLGRNEPATGEMGTFLPDSSGWYPYIAGKLASYRLSIDLPAGQRGIVPGRLIEESDTNEGYHARFEFAAPTGGIDLMAGPYTIETRKMAGMGGKPIQLRTYFHSQIADMAPGYLDSVKHFIQFYESWIGAYPFSEFSVVSSPTPTGFGMPTLTYLGIEVLRLPFIRSTSLGHEVLHNWWGNGVYPDYAHGNWSEGLTTFMADYTYKERESEDAAREMRRGWLRDFAALAPGQDSPLTTFTSRTHGASQIVGYNKAAMMFLMLRDLLGREIFDRSLQSFWRKQRFHIASWKDLQSAFQAQSSGNLDVFFDQWLTRAGAPMLRIAEARRARSASGHAVTLTLEQDQPAYHLRVPVAVQTEGGEQIRLLDLQNERQAFTLDVQARPLEVALDPDLRLFRRLASDEAPPILRQVMVDRTAVTVLLPEGGELRNTAETLASKLQNRSPSLVSGKDDLPLAPALVIGLEEQVDSWLASKHLPARPDNVRNKGSAQAWTVRRPDGSTLAVVSAKDMAALGALIRPLPHYGRQSYVMFQGAKIIGRGAWPTRVQTIKLE